MIKICELSPRDGIQVFKKFIPTDTKVRLIDSISKSGLKEVHITYFAHPKVIPQMRDAEEVASRIKRENGVKYIGFIPNEVGLRRAIYSKVDRVSFFISAEDNVNLTFFRKTTNTLLEDFVVLTREARSEGLEVEAFIVRAFEKDHWHSACELAEKLIKAGAGIVYFSNFGAPINDQHMKQFLRNLGEYIESIDIGIHLYIPKEKAGETIKEALDWGVKRFATSVGGLGLRRIDGNIVTLPPTELVAKLAGVKDISLDKTIRIAEEIERVVEKVGTL